MSDENTPKLRLRPKLAGAPPAFTPAPATPPAESAPSEAAATLLPPALPEAKPVVLRPKLALKGDEPAKVDQTPAATPLPPTPEPGPYLHDPRAFPAPAAKGLQVTPRAKAALSPSATEKSPADSGAVPPFPLPADKDKLPAVLNAPPPSRVGSSMSSPETWPAVLNAPPPPGLGTTIKAGGTEEVEPAEITAIRKASTYPFPAPTAKFPPLPGLASAVDTTPQESSEQEGFLKKLILIGALVVVVLGAGAYLGFKFFVKPALKPAATAPAVSTEAVQPAPASASDTKKPLPAAPVPDIASSSAEPVPAVGAPEAAEATTTPTTPPVVSKPVPPIPAAAPPQVKEPPPQPSVAFKAWVINLRIRGVRGGDAQRVFIERTSYGPGDVVNQTLGIVFMGYDEDTRLLRFQDKTGAVFERRH